MTSCLMHHGRNELLVDKVRIDTPGPSSHVHARKSSRPGRTNSDSRTFPPGNKRPFGHVDVALRVVVVVEVTNLPLRCGPVCGSTQAGERTGRLGETVRAHRLSRFPTRTLPSARPEAIQPHCYGSRKGVTVAGSHRRLTVSTQPCPEGDGGVCSIPEHTLVATGGIFEVRSRDEVLAEFPDLDLEGDLEPVHDLPALREAFRSLRDPGELDGFLRSYADQNSDVEPEESGGLAALARPAATESREVYVWCEPCGDMFTKRVP